MRAREASSAILAIIGLAAAVLAVGGALRWAEALVAILVALAFVPMFVSRRAATRISPLVAIYVCALVVTLIQLIPLPSGLLSALDPVGSGLRDDGAAIAGVSPWHAATLDAPGSLHALAYFTILLGAALVALRFASTERGRLACLGAVAAVCGVTALVIGIHRVFGATSLYGIYTPVQATPPVLGPLLNANHLGGLMALGATVSLGLLLHAKQSLAARAMWGLIALSCTAVVLATLSRGALLALMSGLCVTFGCVVAQRLAKPADRLGRVSRRGFIMNQLPIAIVAACALVVIIFTTAGGAADQLQNTSLQEIHEPKSKFAAWRSSVELIDETPWIGVGRGALEPTFTRVHPASAFVTFSHLENEYVQAVVEFGIPGALILACALGWLAVVALRRWRDGVLAAAALGGLTTLAVQSSVDFGAELLGVAVPATVVAATLAYVPVSAYSSRKVLRIRLGRALALLAMTAAAIVLCLPMTRSVAEDHLTLADDPKPAEIHDAIERHPLDYFGYAVAAQQLAAAHNPNAVPMLNHALRLHPTHSGLHRFAARLLLNAGHTDQAALELASALRATSDPRSTISDIDHMLPPDQAAQAIPVDYDNVELVTHTLVQDGRSDVALTWITKVVAQQPKGLAAIDMMYSLAMSRGNVAAAEQAMRARLAASASPRTTLQLAQLLAKRHANNDIVKLLADVPRWHGLIEDQVSAWLLLCDTQLELGDLDETTRCLRRLDVAGILGAGQRNEITTRLDEIARRRKDAALLERVKDASQPRPADPK